MRQVVTLAIVAAVVSLTVVGSAGAGSEKVPTLRSLQAQIRSLQKQVKSLKKKTADAEQVALVSLAYGACSTAVTADTFQDVFSGLNGYLTANSLPAYFGAQTPLNDYQACQALSVVRTHNQNPPTTSVLGALLDLFKPAGSGTAKQGFMDLAGQARHLLGQVFVLLR